MRTRTKVGLALTAALAAGMAAAAPSALADPGAGTNDAVMVGSDTLQFASAFVADGDAAADNGYNAGKFNRIYDYFATGDANGRFTGAGGTSGSVGSAAETAILRAGTRPVVRPNGSGQGVAALIADSSGGSGYRGLPKGSINIARMSRLPNSGENTSCDNTAGCGGLHAYEIANDTLFMAKAATSNAVALSGAQLWHIYNCDAGYTHWNDPAIGGTSSSTIIPVIPQSGSGTRNFFLQTIDTAAGQTSDPSLSPSCVVTGQEHDPNGITSATRPADAIEPFSAARLTLINSQINGATPYFGNSGSAAGTAATGYTPGAITAITSGTPADSTPLFSTVRGVYLVVRQSDLSLTCSASTSPTCFVPGGTKTIVNSLIAGGPTSTFRASAYQANITAAGFTPKFQDCGLDPDSSATSTNPCITNP